MALMLRHHEFDSSFLKVLLGDPSVLEANGTPILTSLFSRGRSMFSIGC